MENRRQCTRHLLSYNMSVINIRSGKRLGFLLDITPVGFQLVGEQEFREHEIVHVQIQTDSISANDIIVDAVCKWCRLDANRKFWRAGFLICAESSQQSDEIVNIIMDNGI